MYNFEDMSFEVTDIKMDVEEASLSNSESLCKNMTEDQITYFQKGMECVLSSLARILETKTAGVVHIPESLRLVVDGNELLELGGLNESF